MEAYEPHLAIATALAVGLLVGLEREQAHPDATPDMGTAFAGVRTYPIIALLGAISMLLEPRSWWVPLVTLAGLITLLSISYAADLRSGRDHSVTTESSAIATFLLGGLATSTGILEPLTTRLLLVAILGVILTFLLSSKRWLHSVAARVSRDDFYATVKFLIVAVVVLPLLPRHAVGPLDAIEPFSVGLMVVTIAGLSFVGYVAIRLLGPDRGLLVGAALGGLVSSTAVTISYSHRARTTPALAPAAAGAIAIASTIMVGRVAVLVALVNPHVLAALAIPLVAMAAGGVLGGLLTYRRPEDLGDGVMTLKNPFELGNAVRFGVIFAIILLATKAAKVYLGNQGLYLASALGGTTDVDAVSLSAARLATPASRDAVATAIVIAAAVNTIVKSTLALVIGGRALGKRAFLVGALILVGATLGVLAITVVG